MSLAISMQGDGQTLITKKQAREERNMQSLVNFIGSTRNFTPSFNKFVSDNPWVVGNGERPQKPFKPFES